MLFVRPWSRGVWQRERGFPSHGIFWLGLFNSMSFMSFQVTGGYFLWMLGGGEGKDKDKDKSYERQEQG